jgi:hypothetical protein
VPGHGLYLYYLPPYSPELNRIEILWKHAKHFWRRFVARNGVDLLDEIQSLMGAKEENSLSGCHTCGDSAFI